MADRLRDRAPEQLLVDLRQLARHREPPVAPRGQQRLQGFEQAVGRFVNDQRVGDRAVGLERPPALARGRREKAEKRDRLGGEPGSHQGRHERAGAGERDHRNAAVHRLPHQLDAGVAQPRCARVRDQGDVTSLLELDD